MLTLIEAGPLVDELRALKRFPREPGAVKAVGKLLAGNAADAAHGARIVAALLETNAEWPGPAAIVDTARKTSDAAARSRADSESQMAKWRREFQEQTEPYLCQDCGGYGVLITSTGRYEPCGCPEGSPRWVSRSTGRTCRPDDPDAVMYHDDAWFDRINAAVGAKAGIPGLPGGKRKPVQSIAKHPQAKGG